ncbi:MAG: hypothetical protein KA059_04585 [Elusimicrobiales bacterium]|nr:hypothetical protein [Elusimicrobiales bacterium]
MATKVEKNKFNGKLPFILSIILITTACSTYNIRQIPRTQENLSAYRECLAATNTETIGKNYYAPRDIKESRRVMMKCLNTLSSIIKQDGISNSEFKRFKNSTNCEEIENLWFAGNEIYVYYFCSSLTNPSEVAVSTQMKK